MFAAIVSVISLKCVQHKTKPKNIAPWISKNIKEPLFHAFSCLSEKDMVNIFFKRWVTSNKNIRSTPLS